MSENNQPKNSNNNHVSSQLSFQSDGAPYCLRFNDIYFDSNSGYQQSSDIFITANNIFQRFLTAKKTITIAETGFGTGLNFLLTLQAYQNATEQAEHALGEVHFISVEKYPLTKAQLSQSLSILPQLSALTELLVSQYPSGDASQFGESFHAEFFNGKVKLTILFDDASTALENLYQAKVKNSKSFAGLIDIWYLDGFSPAKNPDMWSDELFQAIANLSKEQATLTTFTVAGFVKRKLQSVGFRLEKVASQGKKKEILRAVFQPTPKSKGYQQRPIITKPQHVSIIGGGIASACLALALTKQGVKVTVYCKDDAIAQGGSSNAIGALYPLLHQSADDISLFYQQAFWHAKDLYNSVYQQGYEFDHNWCGLLEVSYKQALISRQQAFEQLNAWPSELIHSVNVAQASKVANVSLEHGGLFMPNAGWAAPQQLVQQIFLAATQSGRLKVKTNTHITKITKVSDKQKTSWLLDSNKGELKASVLVICGGAEALTLEHSKALPLSATRGQVTSMQTNSKIDSLSTVICHKGYLTPENKGIHCIGATFDKNNTSTLASPEDDKYNLAMLSKCLPNLANNIAWQESDIHGSKARLRCMSQDHLPVVGPMPDIQAHIETYPHLAKDKNWRYQEAAPTIDNLYVMLGLGARGLCSAPLAADILSADICNNPYPVDSKMLFNLSPNRFVIRDIIKRKIAIT
ncbi:bifunctional tRNA (5-methylaminomethyl-2-thiouridine)(34)-methyltransferase MnmD/FAD-dependent 5-carboxymethylaminomethyl-2-thiouridine(34) oxidoreductase MnmC [Litorilituus sediminis]|uniref:tRNA 5-methylaminomethyl-2-thiouridine biosynthesis bifunctional protein MnmC n=1 Tax=Litorilituus sediminis TaxID=718192 RepID=A0A4P6P8G2_9GAMM|nr:bifunctional tRNA (5-methylaminomethyl-2-thiouridine)(34)-methyltransferase MnmD/FAD-dependent 5-carboxymethylaminomethyl-2-thiouridine(34) oxidoreductase MnmC [Litorilituus sediminis]QBG37408.1 bifunctional tRNA (5-methylaminomethyl-2-thiouridine)(34)-methyltransferase MnmD/FAD-dependent 5-carboxymethylaminomethyl-2-thiouridine(34) oxidoreductase MnmC [Litorilituus sediminis]